MLHAGILPHPTKWRNSSRIYNSLLSMGTIVALTAITGEYRPLGFWLCEFYGSKPPIVNRQLGIRRIYNNETWRNRVKLLDRHQPPLLYVISPQATGILVINRKDA